jgi:DNA-binding XRE family transcriptional regulator
MIPENIILCHDETYIRSFLHGALAKMAMTPLERKARFRAAATMQEVTMSNAARQLGVSYNHLMLVLNGDRRGSAGLKSRIAAFLGCSIPEVFEQER